LDAFIDPLIGRWSDDLFGRSPRVVLRWAAGAAALLGLGFSALLFPPVRDPQALLMWVTLGLVLTYSAYSALGVMHQSWGARLGGDERQRSQVVAWREGLGLAGLILASIGPLALGLPATTALFFIALAAGWLAWRSAAHPPPAVASAVHPAHGMRPDSARLLLPFRRSGFRALLAVFMVNGIASAVPATLLLFFVQDRLQAAPHWEPLFLGSYFLSAALAIPLWLRLVPRLGLAKTWLLGMLLAIAVFVGAASLEAGDHIAFLVVCALSGAALATDLALPAALLAGTISRSGDQGQAEGAYFGWWNFATKLNLALAAGLALPALAFLGYVPGSRDPATLQILANAYCLLPCGLKLLAAGLLYFNFLHKSP
jgi:Na+/melibiose symporter-like transporter